MSLNSKNDYQFYPTQAGLGAKAWAKFKNKNFIRILEPEAGDGGLIKLMPSRYQDHYNPVPVDCCEIDFERHTTLRAIPGVSIVGFDFMEFGGGSIYSHIIMNPPFAQGVSHVLKAWEIGFDCEIVAIISANDLRNPFTRERKHLLNLIEMHGEVEFIKDAFNHWG